MSNPKTVLLTGITGYIAKHIALLLLNNGYFVVGSVRNLSRGDEVRHAVTPHLKDQTDLDQRLRFVTLDLNHDDGWTDAMEGVDILMHTASPFPMELPRDENDLIRPAVVGVLRALRAASSAGVSRVVLTSSAVAIMEAKLPAGRTTYDERDWSDVTRIDSSAYTKSKTLAERAAWDFANDKTNQIQLTTVNPVVVIGRPLDAHFGTSVAIIQRLLRARDPMLPRFGFPMVDVRDVAEAHLRVLSCPASIANRVIATSGFIWFSEAAEYLKQEFPDRRIVTRKAPDFIVRILAIFDRSIRQILPILGTRIEISNKRATEMLGMSFMPVRDSLKDTASYLIDNDLID